MHLHLPPSSLHPHPRRALLIINPTAGHHSPRRQAAFVKHLEQAGLDVRVMETRYRGHAAEIVKIHLPEADLIIAGGGDGTIAEIAHAMLGQPCPLALWPVGSANVLALELGVPFHDASNATLIASGQTRTLWPGWLTTEGQASPTLFLQMVGVGPDGWVVQQLSTALKKRIGRAAYAVTALRLLSTYPFPAFETDVDGRCYQSRLTIISKGRLYGGPFRLFHHNHHEEAAFSVFMLHRLHPLCLLKQAWAFLCRNDCTTPAFSFIRGRTVTCPGSQPVPAQSDGDFRGTTPLHITSAPAPLTVICPARNQPPSGERNFFRQCSLNIGKRRY
ncbi:diacylglycerol kinase family protein [Bombella apis]|uniref:diacylglycerol/lipid kinase family protein n=1 Tax=Bombella apis TaxID=1785988 RepID=UPI0023F146DB|nr:diacylglycerol kinase family protein [Bombella apis]MCT6845409.1 diacylglycerol kinase [Bombella apis]